MSGRPNGLTRSLLLNVYPQFSDFSPEDCETATRVALNRGFSCFREKEAGPLEHQAQHPPAPRHSHHVQRGR